MKKHRKSCGRRNNATGTPIIAGASSVQSPVVRLPGPDNEEDQSRTRSISENQREQYFHLLSLPRIVS
ncbi:unnamed protein product [Acanthoscelides obtectus]|uniref:Uncharacterized protein n=1 Tax=Acanthoscelides obtectus TaxID=200917 RepID=A0A9P0M0R6_ACAOB|nr:unnamed protein product [Acanthoscelides obtectus]CAK1670399.1 hypothetical protein AOBTE_LOCUS27608 [Acanthoscelides obtectus]